MKRGREAFYRSMSAAAFAPEAEAAPAAQYEGWRSIPIQHQELDPDFQIVPQASVAAYLGEGSAARSLPRQPEELRTLDGDMLLDESNESNPADVYGATLSGRGIGAVAVEDTPFFIALTELDLSDNRVPFVQLAPLPALRDLSLQCNHLRRLAPVPAGGFAALERLNIAMNTLMAADIGQLAALPMLRELDLSDNALESLPPLQRFGALQRLDASSNRLQGDEVYANIAAAPQLQQVILDRNFFRSVDPLIRAAVDAADAKLTSAGEYRGPWATLTSLSLASNRLEDLGGLDVLLVRPCSTSMCCGGVTVAIAPLPPMQTRNAFMPSAASLVRPRSLCS